MAKARESSAFTPQQIADYEDYRRRKPQLLRDIATRMQCWTTCERSACRRGKACLGEDASACTSRAIRGELSDEDRAIFQIALGLRAGGLDAKAAWAEASRRVAQQMAAMDGMGFPTTAG
jgi:hypothetical protein